MGTCCIDYLFFLGFLDFLQLVSFSQFKNILKTFPSKINHVENLSWHPFALYLYSFFYKEKQFSLRIRKSVSEARLPGFKSWCCYPQDLRSWVSYFTSSCLIHHMKMITMLSSRSCYKGSVRYYM